MTDRLYERTAEIAAIDSAVSELGSGRGSAVLLEARAGCGKSSLVDHAVAVAEAAGAQTLLARARHLESASPFGVLRRLLGPAVERLGGPGALDGAARFAGSLFTPGAEMAMGVDYGCQWLVARLAETSPVVLAVDDAHWADTASLRVLLDVQAELSVQPVLLVLASRPIENPEAQRLLAAMAAQPESCVLAPGPLSRRGVTDLLREHFGSEPDRELVEECAAASGGNAFYLRELLRPYRGDGAPPARAAVEHGSVSLVRTVQWRLGELGRDATALAQAAAVLGDGCSLHVAASLTSLDVGVAVRAAARLEAASILAAGDPLEFLHPLVRSAVEETLPQVAIGELHAQAARLLWSRGAPPDAVAQHLLAAPGSGDEQVSEFLTEQGVAALDTGSMDLARRLLRRALDEPAPPARRASLLVRLAQTEQSLGALDTAKSHLEVALDSDERQTRLAAAAQLFEVLDDAGQYDEVARLHRRVLEMKPYGETDVEVRLRSYLLNTVIMGSEPDLRDLPAEVIAVDTAGLPMDRGVDRYYLVMAAIYERTLKHGTTELFEKHLRRAVAGLSTDSELTYWDLRSVLLVATFLADDDLTEPEALLERITPAVVRLRGVAPDLQAELDHRRVLNTMRSGAFEDALSRLDGADEFTARHGLTGYEGPHRFARGWIALERGFYSEAGALLRDRIGDDNVWPALGALLSGDPKTAIAMLEGLAFGAGDHVQQIEVELAPHLIASHAYEALGDRAHAESEALRELTIRRKYGSRFRLAQALRRQASFTTSRRAVPLLEEAVELAFSTSRRPVQVRTLAALGVALRRAGSQSAAREILHQAVDGATEIGMERVRSRAHEELVLAGGRPRRARRTGPASLTDAQQEVADLASYGLTNREIAERLFVTIKTVETHLVAVYRKLGIAGRGELVPALGAAGRSSSAGKQTAPPT